MGRWEPDARGRLRRAALELYAEGGFERTTVLDIAQRAGVTERTFFRHFADKREVLFAGSEALEVSVVDAVAAAPASLAPVDVAVSAFTAAAPELERVREYAGRRAAVIASNPGLRERELLKLAALSAAVRRALRERGVDEPVAGLAAEIGAAVFRAGFERWVAEESLELADCIHAARDALAGIMKRDRS